LLDQFGALVLEGVVNLHYVSAGSFFAALSDGGGDPPTAVGLHLTDAGMASLADFYTAFLPAVITV
jgi:hypothetical protein